MWVVGRRRRGRDMSKDRKTPTPVEGPEKISTSKSVEQMNALERSLQAKLKSKEWAEGANGEKKQMPAWAAEELGRELSLRAREERKMEAQAELVVEPYLSAKGKGATQLPTRRLTSMSCDDQRRAAKLRLRRDPFTPGELAKAKAGTKAHANRIIGVRALVQILYGAGEFATTQEEAKATMDGDSEFTAATKAAKEVGKGGVKTGPWAPLELLESPEREKLFSPEVVAENVLFNAGVTEAAPTDKSPTVSKGPRLTYESKVSFQAYDPQEPDRRYHIVSKPLEKRRLPPPQPVTGPMAGFTPTKAPPSIVKRSTQPTSK